ncbi:MAG: amino acid permease [Gemmatimonadetes bacterium]|nr:amino acid permease [Gemmatimonadota bacterium]MXX71779.1 amino acid permease [Gemmatimonadota bacterium]MYC91754.1 amino acid permease [Gemmatimonadota bacterium]MYG36109.1 amino acid permease [Gemmatimonadota bacterium]
MPQRRRDAGAGCGRVTGGVGAANDAPPPGPGLSADSAAPSSPGLRRELGVWSAGAILVGAIIGSGIFGVPAEIAAEAGTVGAIALLWLAGSAITLCAALSMSELAAMFPRAGGVYVYLREAWGPMPAFVFGWTRLLLIQPAVIGGIALIFAAYVDTLVPLTETGVRVVAAAAIVALGATNARSIAWSAAVQNVSTWAKVLAIVGLSVLIFLFGDGNAGALAAAPQFAPASWTGAGIALIAVLWAYDGWGELLYAAGEVKDPERNLPRALIGGSLVVAAVYLLVNAAYLWVIPVGEMAVSEHVASEAAIRIFGPAGASIVAGLVVVSTFGALNATLLGGPRVFYALAEDGLFFRPVGRIHAGWGTPAVAIALVTILGVGYVSLRTFSELVQTFILGLWPFYILAVWGVFRLRRSRPDHPRPYRVLGYPWVPGVFLLASFAILANALVGAPGSTLFSFGVIGAGVVAYWIWRAPAHRK